MSDSRIDLSKVTHTRCGYKVHNAKYYKDNSPSAKIIANIEFDGSIEPEVFYADGRYYQERESNMDLIESEPEERISHQVEEIDILADLIDSMQFSLYVASCELDRVKREKRDE